MLVVMQEGASEPQIQKVIDRLVSLGFMVHRSSGMLHTVLGGVGPVDDRDPAEFEVMEGVKECHRIVSPYKLASRHFKPGGTVVKVRDVEIGGNAGRRDGGAMQCRDPRSDRASGEVRGGGGSESPSRRSIQAENFSLQLSGTGRRGSAHAARGGGPNGFCW